MKAGASEYAALRGFAISVSTTTPTRVFSTTTAPFCVHTTRIAAIHLLLVGHLPLPANLLCCIWDVMLTTLTLITFPFGNNLGRTWHAL